VRGVKELRRGCCTIISENCFGGGHEEVTVVQQPRVKTSLWEEKQIGISWRDPEIYLPRWKNSGGSWRSRGKREGKKKFIVFTGAII